MILYLIVGALVLVGAYFLRQLAGAAIAAGATRPTVEGLALGAVTNFLDTLGIGSFAPSIAWIRFRKLVPDRLIPLTILAGYILPVILQGVIFLILLGIGIDPWLIIGSIVAMVIGGLLGVPMAARAPIRLVQGIVGIALLLAAIFFTLANLGLMPAGGTATALPLGQSLAIVALHFLLGILLSFGVGNYAPTLAIVSLMGMDPRLAFPIMASAAGIAGAAAATRCLRVVKLDYSFVVGLAIGAIPAVLVAAFIVKEMPVEMLRWLVVIVVSYAGLTLLAAAARKAQAVPDDAAETAIA
jgi:uncharacterized membrane protein YfcA